MKKLLTMLLACLMAATLIFAACTAPETTAENTLEPETTAPAEPTPEPEVKTPEPEWQGMNPKNAQFDLDGDGKLDDIAVPDRDTLTVHFADPEKDDITMKLRPIYDYDADFEYNLLYCTKAEGGSLLVLMVSVGARCHNVLNPYYYNGTEFVPVSWEFDYDDWGQDDDKHENDLFGIEWTTDTHFTIYCNVDRTAQHFEIDTEYFKKAFTYDFSEFDRTQSTSVYEMHFPIEEEWAPFDEETGEFTLEWLVTYGGTAPVDHACTIQTTFEFDAENVMFKITNVEFTDSSEQVIELEFDPDSIRYAK